MKKLISILLAAVMIAAVALTLTGCGGSEAVSVASVMKINEAFRGTRTVTIKYPLSADIDAIKDTILADDPSQHTEGVAFTYLGVEDDGYCFELVFDFNDREDYLREIGGVIGRTASSYLSRKNTVLTQGTRMKENFGTDDLIAWMVRATESESSTKGMEFDYAVNTVAIGADTYSTDKTVDISEVEGSQVKSISVTTTNDKQNHYSRTFKFAIPNNDYVAAKDAIEQYFLSNTASEATYHGWSPDGTAQVYEVKFEDLSMRTLIKVTSMLLDTDSVSISYDDVDNTSTPLSEALAFNESFDTFSFIGPGGGAPKLYYSYVLPPSTIHGDGAVFKDGKWTTAGEWQGDAFQAELDSGSVQLRITDGVQYAIEGIDFHLVSLGGERFRRTTNFLYNKKDGAAGRDYAVSFFIGKGANAEAAEDDEHLICSVVCEGATPQLTGELVKLFGSGNLMAYRKSSGALSLSTKTTFTDYIDLSAILNASNAKQPMRYYVSASGAENIVSILMDGSEKTYVSAQKSYVEFSGGVATFEYYGSIPITSHIILYVVFGLILLGATIFGAYLMLRRRRSTLSKSAQDIVDSVGADDDADLASLTQTTTFSIAELGILSRNKRYVDEINKDVEERIEMDRLDRRKKEIRQKELEEMERKVYGTGDSSARPTLEDVPELDISVLKLPAEDDAPTEPAEAEPPKPAAEAVNPFSLLDDAVDEGDEADD